MTRTNFKFSFNVEVNINAVPENFEELIVESFKHFTSGTAKDYCYQDKLMFIDKMGKFLNAASDSNLEVKNLIKEHVDFELDEYGDFPDKDDFWNLEWMESCFEAGQESNRLYQHFTGNRHIDDVVMKLAERAIKAVMNYEE